MTTQLESARKGTRTSEMKAIAVQEDLDDTGILHHMAKRKFDLPCNANRTHHKIADPVKGLRTQVKAVISTASDNCGIGLEMETARVLEEKQTSTLCQDFCAMKKGMQIVETDIREER
jgi:phosphomethylpyrimidine synthase